MLSLNLVLARSDGAPVFFFLIVVVGVVVALLSSHASRQAQEELCRRLAHRLREGSVEPGGLFELPGVRYTVDGSPARIRFQEGKQPLTSVQVDLRRPSPGTLKVIPEGLGQSLLKILGAQDVEIGDRVFDANYVIKACPENFARQIFHPSRRDQVMASVRRINALRDPSIEVGGRQLEVRVAEKLQSEAAILALVRTAEDFVQYLQRPDTSDGIRWIEIQESSKGVCLVCGTALSEPLVRCGRCHTPCHQECWTYVGQCSTFGCSGGRSSRRAA